MCPMTLEDWIIQKQLTDAEAAVLLGVDRTTVCRYRNGRRYPSPFRLGVIAKVTGGAVMPNDWFLTSAVAQ
jgi:DNA-binding transcriptional regulator YdaS (Cro superfamily)